MRTGRDIGAERHSELTEHTGQTGPTDDGSFHFEGDRQRTSRMGKRGSEVGDAGQEDGVRLMVMVGEEDELIPVVRAGPKLEQLVQAAVWFGGRLHPDHLSAPLQVRDPVVA